MKQLFIFFQALSMVVLLGCSSGSGSEKSHPIIGLWRGVLQVQEQELPFHFRLSGRAPDSLYLTLINGKEELLAGQVQMKNDSLLMPMHIFDTEIRAAIIENKSLVGSWFKNYAEDYVMPFRAKKGESFRFEISDKAPAIDLNGRWSVSFMKEDSSGAPNAVGIFQQNDRNVTGTFLTPTGDYRYLEGNISGKNLYLSTFDGEHAFLFHATAVDSNRLEGTFWSGKKWEEKWIAIRNNSASLPSADSLTYLNEGYDRLEFSFPDLEGKQVSLSDPKYKDKVVIVQLFGTWCPNCMDETRFLAEWKQRNPDKAVEIIGLAYEQKQAYEYARDRVLKMKDKLGANYDFLIAGTADKAAAAKTLPMLNHVMAFPTTIFIDKQGKIRRIHTGFSGPGTGEAYEDFVEDFNLFVGKLLNEPLTTTAP